MKTLVRLFLDELADIYYVENRLVKALPKLAKAATHEELRQAFEAHLRQTEAQVAKVEEVFAAFGEKPRAKKCEAITGLIEEANRIAADNKGSPTINAALISAAQKVEHYEIASYGCLREWADQLGNVPAVDLLQEILDEEKAADAKLTTLARTRCNEAAEETGGFTGHEADSGRNRPLGRGRRVACLSFV
jgi:ferritin-like metal-binding protein YciE